MPIHVFEPPERFIVGTVGEPGDRSFYLQASGDGRTVSVAMEKVQVSLLAEKMTELLDEVARRFDPQIPASVPNDDNEPLQSPVEEEFRVTTLGLAWDEDTSTVVLEASAAEATEDDEDEETEPTPVVDPDVDTNGLRVRLTPQMARAFVSRAERVVEAGRPTCPLCTQPMDPAGHVCPRQNGYRR